MPLLKKPIAKLTIDDLCAYPVWRYLIEEEGVDGQDETWVTPMKNLPLSSLANCIVGTQLRLHNGEIRWAILSNIISTSLRKTQIFITVEIERDGEWFPLMRPIDAGYDKYGPKEFAEFLYLPLADVFPISYDLSGIAIGDPTVIKGIILAEPPERLTKEELIALALEAD